VVEKLKIIKFFQTNKEKLPSFYDVLIFCGIAMAGRGLYLIYEPAMWIVCGIFIVYLGWPKKVVE